MAQILILVLRFHPDMVHGGTQKLKLSFVLPTLFLASSLLHLLRRFSGVLFLCRSQSIERKQRMDRDLIACDFRTSIPALPIRLTCAADFL